MTGEITRYPPLIRIAVAAAAKCRRFVPVVKMAAILLHLFERVECHGRYASVFPLKLIQPKSRAATVESKYMPILVGEVRVAITG